MLLVVREFYQLAWELVDRRASSCMGIGVLNGKTCCSCREFYLAREIAGVLVLDVGMDL